MTAKQLYDYITERMTPEEALLKLLESSLIEYSKLKFNDGDEIHPIIIIANAAMDLGWDFCVEKGAEDVRGLTVGTREYIDDIFKEKKA